MIKKLLLKQKKAKSKNGYKKPSGLKKKNPKLHHIMRLIKPKTRIIEPKKDLRMIKPGKDLCQLKAHILTKSNQVAAQKSF